MRIFIFLILNIFLINVLNAQDLNISQYIFYRDGLNPASFTQNNDVNIFVLNNNQFTGFEQEPTTKVADVSFRLNDYKLGVSFINDIIGFDKSQNVKIRFARQFSISEKSSFSLGLSAGTIHKRLEATKMTFEFGDDPMSYYDIANTRFDFDFGCEFLVNNFFVGFSVNHLGILRSSVPSSSLNTLSLPVCSTKGPLIVPRLKNLPV